MRNSELRVCDAIINWNLSGLPPSVTRVARATFPSRGKANIGSPLDGELSPQGD